MIRSHVAALRSARSRAALSLGVVLALGSTGTFAAWTDSASLSGTSFTSGTLDVKLANSTLSYGDSAASTTLSLTNMIPGATSAEVISLKNNNNVPFKWSLTGGLNGNDATTFAGVNAISLTIRDNGTKSGTGATSTCTGGSVLFGPTALTDVTSTSLLTGQGGSTGLIQNSVKSLCFQFTFDSNAANALQGKSLGAAFTFTGTSDLS